MIVDSPEVLMLSLVVATILGILMGYCVARLRAKRRAREVILAARAEVKRQLARAEADLKIATDLVTELRESQSRAIEQAKIATQREAALDLHSQLQAQRIQTLESQVASYEDQQIRRERDFASYRSNKSRELELAKSKSNSWTNINELPVLQKRVVEPGGKRGSQGTMRSRQDARYASMAITEEVVARRRNPHGLSTPLSRELDFPSLAESALPDSVEDLEFELADQKGKGSFTRG